MSNSIQAIIDAMPDDQHQRVEWKARLIEQLWTCRDHETFMDLLIAGLDQAEHEAMLQSAGLLSDIAAKTTHPERRRALEAGASAITRLAVLNRVTS